ncbi:MAG TPA: hypothetical protein VGO72_02555, partial [Herminiimonas sp.]|nr:hypothetical protein [Herminiimonas sp.]
NRVCAAICTGFAVTADAALAAGMLAATVAGFPGEPDGLDNAAVCAALGGTNRATSAFTRAGTASRNESGAMVPATNIAKPKRTTASMKAILGIIKSRRINGCRSVSCGCHYLSGAFLWQ